MLEAVTRSNSVKLFKKLAWLPFYDEVKLIEITLVFKRLQGSCPACMYDLLKFNADLHTRTGRYNKLNLACPRFNRKPINLKKRRQQLLFSERTFIDIFYQAAMK